MDPPSLSIEKGHCFPLMDLPQEARDVIYRHALGHARPDLVLPRWMHGMQRWRECSIGAPVVMGRVAASSFTNLQLANRKVYEDASHILYRNCTFSFVIAPCHASFLDACLLPGLSTWNIQDKIYIHRITNIVLSANWDGYDRAHIRRFVWSDWEAITTMVCRALVGFAGLRKLTLDWRVPVPEPCEVLQPTAHQWLSIAPRFEWLRMRRPDVCVEVVAWQMVPGSVPLAYQEVRGELGEYAGWLRRAAMGPDQCTPVSLPS